MSRLRHQGKRGEEMLAELPVPHPWLPRPLWRAKESVSMNTGLPAVELNVVGARVLQGHAVAQVPSAWISSVSFVAASLRALKGHS